MGKQPAVRRHAGDADAVVHAPADGAGHFGAVRIATAAGGAARVQSAALGCAVIPAHSGAAPRSWRGPRAWRRCRNRAPRPCAAASGRRRPNPSRSSCGPTVRRCRDRWGMWRAPRVASSADRSRPPDRSSIDVVRKSGPSQSGSTYSTSGALMIATSCSVGTYFEKVATTKLRVRSIWRTYPVCLSQATSWRGSPPSAGYTIRRAGSFCADCGLSAAD